jgi:hypothetical protein
MMAMLRRVRAKVPNVALGVIVGLVAGGGAFAIAQTTGSDDGGVHGGPKPRFHDARECNLVDVSKLPGNWTHGDYVSAVAKADPSKVRDAAHSRCGKPSHAGKGGGKGPKQKDESDKEQPAKPSKSPKPSAKASSTATAGPTATASASPSSEPIATPSPTASASS